MAKGFQSKSYKEKLKELSSSAWKKESWEGDMVVVFRNLKSCPIEEGTDSLPASPEGETNGLQLQEREFWLDFRKSHKSGSATEPVMLGVGCSFLGAFWHKLNSHLLEVV